jgi:hypothetical protein
VEKKKFFTLLGLGLPARSQSLYRLRYPGSHLRLYSDKYNDESITNWK